MKYKICDSPYTTGMYIIKYKRYWWMPWLMYGHYDYNWHGVNRELKRLQVIQEANRDRDCYDK